MESPSSLKVKSLFYKVYYTLKLLNYELNKFSLTINAEVNSKKQQPQVDLFDTQ